MAGELQEGIFYQQGVRPGQVFAIAFFQVEEGATAQQVGEELQALWQLYQRLKVGDIPDLPGHPVPPGELKVLIGYGPLAFKLPGAQKNIPEELAPANRFRSPRTVGGGPLLVNSGLFYADDINKNVATEPIMVQLIAETQLAVNRALIESWKFLFDYSEQHGRKAVLTLAAFFTGFQRDDGRSWLDFHDGLSNLRSGAERQQAITIKSGDYAGGTCLGFLRLAVDLELWRKIKPVQQEILVGRHKLTGCPFTRIGQEGVAIAVPGCPVVGTIEVGEGGAANQPFHEPPIVGQGAIRQSHVQRANLQHNQTVSDPQSLRIFRQGYEFLEPLAQPPGFRVGLNFVSFQDTPQRLIRILTRQGWLGMTNFGGDVASPLPGMDRLLTVRAGAVFLVPPVVGNELPGATIFAAG